MALVAGVRCSLPGKDAGSARIHCDTGATEDADLGASSAARRHSRQFAEPSYSLAICGTILPSGRTRAFQA